MTPDAVVMTTEQIVWDLNNLPCDISGVEWVGRQDYDKYKKLAEDLAEACEKFKLNFLDKYHPGENWFPETLIIGEALAKYRKALEGS